MGKTKSSRAKTPSVGSEIIEGLQNAVAFAKGNRSKGRVHRIIVPPHIDVKRVRRKLGMSQGDFAERFGINTATLRNWEQAVGNRKDRRASCYRLSIASPPQCSEFYPRPNKLLLDLKRPAQPIEGKRSW